jgi:hypothetical protein
MMSNADSERFSPLLLARILGFAGLAGIATGAFDIGYVHNTLTVAGNAPATLHNIVAHQTLFRAGISAHLFEMLLNIIEEILGYFLLRRVNGIVAALSLCAGVVGIAVESAGLLFAYLPLTLAVPGSTLSGFAPEQWHAVSNLAMQLQETGLLLSFAFYGFDELLGGYLIFRSGFWPRILGVLLAISGFCYLTNTFLSFLAPALDARVSSYMLYACFPGEFLTSLWFATVGLNVAKWRAWTTEPQRELVTA